MGSSNVKTVALPSGEDEATGSLLAVTMEYKVHERDGKVYNYTSGILKSTIPSGIAYGRFEARIKGAPRWPGVCPAFWAWRRDPAETYWTELDFVEMLENSETPKDIDFTTHVFPPTPGVKKELSNSSHVLAFDPRDDFHVYAMEWNATDLTWWVDDVVVKHLPSSPYFDKAWPMDIAISFGLRAPLKEAPSSEGFPTTFYVDWIRVWKYAEIIEK